MSRYEAPRGEDVHYVRGNGTEKPERVKVRAPTLANFSSVSKMLEDGYLADLPIVIAAIDPVLLLHGPDGVPAGTGSSRDSRTLTWEEVSRMGVQWHRDRGLDFSRLRIPGGAGA